MRRDRLLVVLIGLALCATALNGIAADWYVDPVDGSDSNGGTSWEDAWKTLTYATSITNRTGTEEDPCIIHLAAGTYSPSSNGETFPVQFGAGGIYNDWASLIGAGKMATIVDAEATQKVLKTDGENITVSSLTITGGGHPTSNSSGGGIWNGAQLLTLERCNVRDNSQGMGLSQLYIGDLQMIDCEFTGNNGPADDPGAGMRFYLFTDVTMINCLVAHNTTNCPHSDNGGGVFIDSDNHVTLINCTVVDNHKKGIYAQGASGSLELYNCVLRGNDDDLDGMWEYIDLYISHCNISDGDGLGSNGNISQDPVFVTGAQGNYYLSHAGVNSKKEDKKAE